MPPDIETALTKMISKFLWGDSKPRIASTTLHAPITNGGLDILDIKTSNEAIEIIWLKAYLNFSPSRQPWATLTDLIILATTPCTGEGTRTNPFLQTWNAPTKGPRVKLLNDNIK
jgi:hypothetical protein